MLKTLASSNFHNFKCGEIFCLTATTYSVNCCLCGVSLSFDEFPDHFKINHLSLLEDPINLPEDIVKEEEVDGQELETVTAVSPNRDDKPKLEENPIETNFIEVSENIEEKGIDESQDNNYEEDGNGDDAHDQNWKQSDAGSSDSEETEDVDDKERGKKSEDRPFPCSKCDRSYKSKRGLWNHLRINHNPNSQKKQPKKQHICQECGESFRSERHLRGHQWKHTGIQCDICGKSFTQTGNMVRHKIRHSGVKAFNCTQCDYSFYTEKELRSHQIRHTGVMPIICEICGRRCRDHGVLTAHKRRHTGERPAKCEVCGKSFFSFHDLNVHAVTHTTERPFACETCGSTFQRKKALRVHKKLHSTERKHTCKVCGKGFAQSSGLNAHMKRHDTATRTQTLRTNSNINTNVVDETPDIAIEPAVNTIETATTILITNHPSSILTSITSENWNT